jgi:hypothetical protein
MNRRRFLQLTLNAGLFLLSNPALSWANKLPRKRTVYATAVTHACHVDFYGKNPDGTEVSVICGVNQKPDSNTLLRITEFDDIAIHNPKTGAYVRYREFGGHIIVRSVDPDQGPPDKDGIRYLFLAVAKETGNAAAKSCLVTQNGLIVDPQPTKRFASGKIPPPDLNKLNAVIVDLHQKCDQLVQKNLSVIDRKKIEPPDGPETENFRFLLNNNLQNILN